MTIQAMAQTLLVVDDEANLRDMLKVYFEQEGFRVLTAPNGRAALPIAREQKPDLIILDLMMPEMGGYDFMRAYTTDARTPVIMLTAKVEDSDTIIGLELGADDYVTKPFNVRELIARVRAVLRRAHAGTTADAKDLLRVSDIALDRAMRTVEVAGAAVELTKSEFDLLATLMASPGRVFSRLDLLDALSGDAFEGYERTIDQHVRNLRSKIEADSRHPIYVETVYGMGYRFALTRKANGRS